jgi:hypothetical protein
MRPAPGQPRPHGEFPVRHASATGALAFDAPRVVNCECIAIASLEREITMKRALTTLTVAAGLAMAGPALASEDHDHEHAEQDHYSGKPARTLEQAVTNLREYSAKLDAKMNGDLSAEDMHEIHKLSYTLENALARLGNELEDIKDNLESVHLASERQDRQTISDKGKLYMKDVNLILNGQ